MLLKTILKKIVSVFNLERKIFEKKTKDLNIQYRRPPKQILAEDPIANLFMCCLIS